MRQFYTEKNNLAIAVKLIGISALVYLMRTIKFCFDNQLFDVTVKAVSLANWKM